MVTNYITSWTDASSINTWSTGITAVIFCRTRREMIKEVKKLLKRKEVDPRSIRIFALMGGAEVVKK